RNNQCKEGSGLNLIIDTASLTIGSCERDSNQIIFTYYIWPIRYCKIENYQSITRSRSSLTISTPIGPFNPCLCTGSTDTDGIAIHVVNKVAIDGNRTSRIETRRGLVGPGTT